MPLDHGCWLDQHHGVEDLRPSSVKPQPEEPVCGEEWKPAFALTPEHGDLVPKGDKFKFQRGAAANTEREQRSESGKNCDVKTSLVFAGGCSKLQKAEKG